MSDIKHGIAGGMAGITVDIVFYPLETIKTRIMASSLNQNLKNLALSKFKGFSCQMIASFPYSFSFFYTYETMRSVLGISHFHNCVSSVVAEITANLVRNPFEIIKQQMMVGRSDKILQSFNLLFKEKGFFGLYIGLKHTLARDILFSGIQLPIFQFFRHKFMEKGYNSVASASLGGMIGACVAGFLSCPLDVIKTRLMTQKIKEQSQKKIVRQIYQQFGVRGFFKGVQFRCGILTFGGSIYFSSLQFWRKAMKIQ